MNFLLKLYQIIDPRKMRVLLALQVLLLFVAVIEVMGIASIAPFMAVVANPSIIHSNKLLKTFYDFFHFQSDLTFLEALGYLVLVLLIFGNILILLANWLMTSFGSNLGRTLAVNLYGSYLRKNYLFHTMNNSAVLAKNVSTEVWRVSNNVIIQLLTLNSKIFTILFILSGLFFLNPLITGVATFLLGFSYVLIYFFIKRKLQFNSLEMRECLSDAAKAVSEGLGGVKEVKVNGKEAFYTKIYDDIMARFSTIITTQTVIPLIPRYFLEIIAFGGIVSSIIFKINSGTPLAEFLPILSIFAMASFKLLPAFQSVFGAITTIKSNLFSFYLIFDDLEKSKDSFVEEKTPLERLRSEEFKTLEIKQAHFQYPGTNVMVLKNLNLTLKANQSYAFVGKSGSGKSTLIDVIAGLFELSSGEIFINGEQLNSNNLRSWQNQLGLVPQSVYLQDGTFAQNIAFGVNPEKIDQEKVRHCARMASIESLIESKPKRYETRIGERGIQLSGGQRQRIGIARALYNEASVLIFDEATSALDHITETEIMESIESLSGKKTIILIAHRLSTVKNCHEIFMMDQGVISDRGTYDYLLQNNKTFKAMANDESK